MNFIIESIPLLTDKQKEYMPNYETKYQQQNELEIIK